MHHVTTQIAQFFQLRRALAKWITATEDAVMLEVQNIHATRIQAVYRGHLDRMDVLAMRRAIAAEEARKLKVRAALPSLSASLPACSRWLLTCYTSPANHHPTDSTKAGAEGKAPQTTPSARLACAANRHHH